MLTECSSDPSSVLAAGAEGDDASGRSSASRRRFESTWLCFALQLSHLANTRIYVGLKSVGRKSMHKHTQRQRADGAGVEGSEGTESIHDRCSGRTGHEQGHQNAGGGGGGGGIQEEEEESIHDRFSGRTGHGQGHQNTGGGKGGRGGEGEGEQGGPNALLSNAGAIINAHHSLSTRCENKHKGDSAVNVMLCQLVEAVVLETVLVCGRAGGVGKDAGGTRGDRKWSAGRCETSHDLQSILVCSLVDAMVLEMAQLTGIGGCQRSRVGTLQGRGFPDADEIMLKLVDHVVCQVIHEVINERAILHGHHGPECGGSDARSVRTGRPLLRRSKGSSISHEREDESEASILNLVPSITPKPPATPAEDDESAERCTHAFLPTATRQPLPPPRAQQRATLLEVPCGNATRQGRRMQDGPFQRLRFLVVTLVWMCSVLWHCTPPQECQKRPMY